MVDAPADSQVEPPVQVEEQDAAEAATPKKVFSQEQYDGVINAWRGALAVDAATPPFTGDLENPVYLNILQTIRDFKPE